jgi:tetraacyldisaccharide 4'-kinase
LFKFLRFLLLPFSLVYGLGIALRNLAYQMGWLSSYHFDFPVIVVGNLSVGGTGKTPHVEYLLRLFTEKGMNVATLSRGYKRNTRGFVLIDEQTTAKQVGDEPKQLKMNNPSVHVAVCENRVTGIHVLHERFPDLDVVLLDDAFQHRRLRPSFSILLTDYHRPFWKDFLLPVGNLREWSIGKKRANVIVVSKSPAQLSAFQKQTVLKQIGLRKNQEGCFSHLSYCSLYLLANRIQQKRLKEITGPVFLLTALANPASLHDELIYSGLEVRPYVFPDHHFYTEQDLNPLFTDYNKETSAGKIIITTEKDAVKLAALNLPKEMDIFVLPVRVAFDDGGRFDEAVLKSIRL